MKWLNGAPPQETGLVEQSRGGGRLGPIIEPIEALVPRDGRRFRNGAYALLDGPRGVIPYSGFKSPLEPTAAGTQRGAQLVQQLSIVSWSGICCPAFLSRDGVSLLSIPRVWYPLHLTYNNWRAGLPRSRPPLGLLISGGSTRENSTSWFQVRPLTRCHVFLFQNTNVVHVDCSLQTLKWPTNPPRQRVGAPLPPIPHLPNSSPSAISRYFALT